MLLRGLAFSFCKKLVLYSEEKKTRSLFTAMKGLLGFCCSDRFEHLVTREIITRFVLQVQLMAP